ncbi:MAG: VanZ family protein [Deltaproteobacteria bacterium]|nr:VanZ family protein [Deltaproteobacteria bacterium]
MWPKIKWIIVVSYWIFLTYGLLSCNPWIHFGGEHRIRPYLNPESWKGSFLLHAGGYGVLGLLLINAISKKTPVRILGWLIVGMLHGGACEYLQGFIPNRWTHWMDATANCVGLLLSWMVAHVVFEILSSLRKRYGLPLCTQR